MSNPAFPDEHGCPLSPSRIALVRSAYQTLKDMTPHERGLVFCWFCPACFDYIPPGGRYDDCAGNRLETLKKGKKYP